MYHVTKKVIFLLFFYTACDLNTEFELKRVSVYELCDCVLVCVLRPCQQPVAAMSILFECVSLPPGQVKKKAVNQYLSKTYFVDSIGLKAC